MKFVSGIIAALLVSSEAYRIDNKKVDARKLMRSAVQVDPKTLRKLQNENDGNNAFQITNAHSIRFNSCTSLTTSSPNDETMFGDLIQYTKSGQIVAEKSFVLFNICETDSCSYYSNSDPLYMVDLATYMGSVMYYMPQQHQEYCRACEESQDYCLYGGNNQQNANQAQDGQQNQANEGQQQQNGEQGQQQQNGEQGQQQGEQGGEGQQQGGEQGGGQRRSLQNNNNFEVIDCDVCEARDCFANQNDQQNGNQQQNADGYVVVNEENIAAWVDGIAQCQQTGSYWDAFPLYAGFICNGDGSGVEIGLFLDQECSIYTSYKSYKNVVSDSDKELFYNSQEIVTYPFLHPLSCGNQVQYISPEQYENMQANGNNGNNQNGNDNGEASEMCRELMNGQAMNVNDCDANGQADDVNNEVQEEETAGYSWYAYTIASENAGNTQAVCQILQTMEGEYTVVYNSNEKHGSGSFYDYSTKSGFQKKKGLFVTFIVLGVVAVVAAVFVSQGSKAKRGKRGDGLLID